MALPYDELYISTMREMSVCREKIAKLRKGLAEMEEKHGMETAEFVAKFRDGSMKDHEDHATWYERYQGLMSWEQRLKAFDEILRKN